MGATREPRWHDAVDSPVGPICVVARGTPSQAVIVAIRFDDGGRDAGTHVPGGGAVTALREALRQLGAYLRGDRTTFDLPLAADGTPFQQQVWNALMRIPYGATASYGDVARWLRRPDAVRAVGAANGANPIAIVVPCHRVIGADGRLVGYGGGLERKRWLLAHEANRSGLFA